MHPSALEYGRLFFETYTGDLPDAALVMDIGAQDVNGSLKSVCPSRFKYVGVDFVEGRGVDVIIDDPYALPFEDGTADVVVCSSCFEHSEMFWLVFNEIMRVLKPTGVLYLNVPSNGYIHRYPVDCWRFYPDSGQALVTWGKRSGYQPGLLESFMGKKFSVAPEGLWNDFVAVFVKDGQHAGNYPRKIIEGASEFTNARLSGSTDLIKFSANPEDFNQINSQQQLINSHLRLMQKAELQLTEQNAQAIRLMKENAELKDQLARQQNGTSGENAYKEALQNHILLLEANIEQLKSELSTL